LAPWLQERGARTLIGGSAVARAIEAVEAGAAGAAGAAAASPEAKKSQHFLTHAENFLAYNILKLLLPAASDCVAHETYTWSSSPH